MNIVTAILHLVLLLVQNQEKLKVCFEGKNILHTRYTSYVGDESLCE